MTHSGEHRMIHFNLGSHDGRTIEELTSLVEATERAAFTTELPVAASPESERVLLASAPTQSQPLSEPFKTLSPEELARADDAFHFDLRSDFDEMYGREEFEEEVCD